MNVTKILAWVSIAALVDGAAMAVEPASPDQVLVCGLRKAEVQGLDRSTTKLVGPSQTLAFKFRLHPSTNNLLLVSVEGTVEVFDPNNLMKLNGTPEIRRAKDGTYLWVESRYSQDKKIVFGAKPRKSNEALPPQVYELSAALFEDRQEITYSGYPYMFMGLCVIAPADSNSNIHKLPPTLEAKQ